MDEVDRLLAQAKKIKADQEVKPKRSVLVPYHELLKKKVPAIITEKCIGKWNNNDHVLAKDTLLYFITEAGSFGKDPVTQLTGVYLQSLVYGAATMYTVATVPRECVRVLTAEEYAELKDKFTE